MTSRTVTRSLTLLAAWLIYACGNAPTAPEAEPAAPGMEAGSVESTEALEAPDVAPAVDALLGWALESGKSTTDQDARIAHAILELTEDRKEILP